VSGSSPISYSNQENVPIVSDGMVVFKKTEKEPVSANIGVLACRHPVLGLGFSDVVDMTWSERNGRSVLEGKVPGRGKLLATFRPGSDTELESMTIADDSWTSEYKYEPYQTIDNIRMPAKVSLTDTADGQVIHRVNYDIKKVKFNSARIRSSSNWFLPGNIFVDERLERPVRFQYSELLELNGGSTDLTQEKLLEFSKRKLARELAHEARPQQRQPNYYPYFLAALVLLGVLGAGYYYIRERRNAA
jgi:hypothetical protein